VSLGPDAPPAAAVALPRLAFAALLLAAWSLLVSRSPPWFFAAAAPLCLLWLGASAAAAPPGLRARLRPRAGDVAVGLLAGLALYALTRLFLAGACGGITDALCRPTVEMYVRFRPRAVLPALTIALLVAPAEELFWRGVVQGHLAARLRPAVAVGLATGLAVAVALAAGEPLLALATAPTYAAWGALATWRRSLVPAIASHALWSVLVASVAPPV
jgi:membrane protease YdiL (CAAX protease family)